MALDTEKFTQIHFAIPRDLKKEVKKYCAENDIYISEFVRKAVEEALKKGV